MMYGFENFRGNEKNWILCHYVIVFLLREIHCKWKQPIVYYFCQSVPKIPQLIKCINKMVKTVQATEL